MWLRSSLLLPATKALPDQSAKIEVLEHKGEGKEHPAVIAYREKSLGFGFSAAGLLFPYHLGVVKFLSENHIIAPGAPMAGASAGSLIAACYNAGIKVEVITELFLLLANDLRTGGAFRRMGPCLQALLEEHLPEDAHLRCSGNTHVAITAAFPYARGQVISEFESKADLIQCLLTSCHIPMYFAGSFSRTFRGRLCYDGGVTNFIPVPPPQAPSSYATRVCCFPSKTMGKLVNIHISPDTFDDEWADVSMSEMFGWALSPATVEVYDRVLEKGELDASAWATLTGVMTAACPDPDDWYRHQFLEEKRRKRKSKSTKETLKEVNDDE